ARQTWTVRCCTSVKCFRVRTTSLIRTRPFRPRRLTGTLLRRPSRTARRCPFTYTVTRRTRLGRTPRIRIEIDPGGLQEGRLAGMAVAAPAQDAPPTAMVARWAMSREDDPTITP